MNSLFEYSDSLRTPYESFLFDTATANFPIHPHWHKMGGDNHPNIY